MKHLNKYINNSKTMSKKVIVLVALVLAPIVTFGQSIFDRFEDMEDVGTVILNQKMFSMLASIDLDLDDPEEQAFYDMVKKISGLKVFTTGNESISADMNASVTKYLKKSDLEELMRIKDGGQTVKFYVKEGKDDNHVKELLMFVNGLKEMTKDSDITINGKKREIETVIITLTGDIDLRQISKLANKMDLPGGEQLKKANKN